MNILNTGKKFLKSGFLPAMLILLASNVIITSIFLQFNNNYRLNLAGSGLKDETFNFNPIATSDDPTMTLFRWCFHKSGISFRGVSQGADYTLRLFISARDGTYEGRYLRAKIDRKKLFEGAIDIGWKWVEIKIPSSLIKSDRVWFLLYTKPFVLAKNAVRGVRVAEARLELEKKHGILIPSSRHIGNTTIFLFLYFLVFIAAGLKNRNLIIAESSIIILINAVLLTPLKDPLIRGMSWLIINAVLVLTVTLILKFMVPALTSSLKLPYQKADNNKVALLSALSLGIKSGLWFIPFTPSIDLVFHVHMLQKIFSGDFLNMSRAGNYNFPYPPGFYMLFEPFRFLTDDNFLLIRIGFAFFMAFVPLIIYLIALKLFKDRRAAFYALILSIVMPKDFYIYILGIISNGFGHFMMLLSVALTVLLYDRITELKTGFLLYIIYTLTALSHFGVMISFILLMLCFTAFLFAYEIKHHGKMKTAGKPLCPANPSLFKGGSLRIMTLLICALATAFFFYYIRLINPTLKNIASMLLANETDAQAKGVFWFSGHNLLKFLQNIIIKFGIFPFIAGIAAIIVRLRQKTKDYPDMLIFGWFTAFLIQWWLAMKESLMLRFELFALPLFAITAGWLFARMKKEIFFKITVAFCLVLSFYFIAVFYSDIDKIGSIIIPHKELHWILW